MKKELLLSSFILLGAAFPLMGIAASPSASWKTVQVKQKAKRQSKKAVDSKKILPMKEYIDQLMAKMTLQEKIGQLNLMVAGDITTGNAMDTQVAGDITLEEWEACSTSRVSTRLKPCRTWPSARADSVFRSSWAWTLFMVTRPSSLFPLPSHARGAKKL